MEMKMKMEDSSDRYEINRPWSRDKQKYTKYKKCLSIMVSLW